MNKLFFLFTLILANSAQATSNVTLAGKNDNRAVRIELQKKTENNSFLSTEKNSDSVMILNLSNGKKLMIYDSAAKVKSGEEKRTGSGGGWQPETKQTPEEAVAVEIIRLAAQEVCESNHIAAALDEAFSQTSENLVLDISELPKDLKACLLH